MLIGGKVEKQYRGGVLLKKAESLLIPYVIWVGVLGGISAILDRGHIIENIVVAAKELWFFPTLFAIEAVLILYIKIFKGRKLVIGFGLIVLFVTCFCAIKQAAIARRLFFLGLVILGYCIQKHPEKTKMKLDVVGASCYILFMAIAGKRNFFTSEDNLTPGYKLILVFGMSILGGCFVFLLAKYIAKTRFCGVLCMIGTNTLYIYVLHYAVLKPLSFLLINKFCLLGTCLVIPIIIQYFIKGTLVDKILFKPQIVSSGFEKNKS